MFAKITLFCLLVAVAAARPDKPRAYNYQAPARAFNPRQTYQAPEPASPEDSYEAPEPDSPEEDSPEVTYEAPRRSYSAPAPAYKAPAPKKSYSAPAPAYTAPDSDESEEDYEPLMPFDFGYIVDDDETESAYGHKSNSDGQQVTGQYRVLLPDGRTQIVTYTADKENGFQATVTYEGEARPWVPPTDEDSDEDEGYRYQAPQSAYSAPQ